MFVLGIPYIIYVYYEARTTRYSILDVYIPVGVNPTKHPSKQPDYDVIIVNYYIITDTQTIYIVITWVI